MSGDSNVNGHENTTKFIETIDPDDPEYRRELQRPPDVKEDMRQMESRQRVSSILNSQAFREELESIIADQLKHGPHPSSLIALQHISELLLPTTRWNQVSALGKVFTNNLSTDLGNTGSVVIPINDVRSIDSTTYGKGERLIRCKFASLFRLIDLYGWSSNGINNCATLRLNQELDHYLINPFGLLYHEVTASSLVKIDLNQQIIEHGSTTYSVNKHLFQLHSAIYKARPDIKCIVHIQTQTTNAISTLKCGLLALTQEAILCGNISYHEYRGGQNYKDDDVKSLLANDFGPINKILFVRNYGVFVCGETIEETWFYMINLMSACEQQLRSMSAAGGLDNLYLPSDEYKRKFIDNYAQQLNDTSINENRKWKIGELEFEACMRCLDNAAYRTGYVYRQPVMRQIDRNAIKEVEIPPCSTSYGIEDYKRQKAAKSAEWLSTPNTYQKTELEETGPFAKKVTKWVSESSPNKTSTPIRIDNKNQFAPPGGDPKELKNHQKQIKQDRYDDKKTPGYQSKILENINNDDNDQVDAVQTATSTTSTLENGHSNHQKITTTTITTTTTTNGGGGGGGSGGIDSSPSSNATYVYGAASKGIIKRDQQNSTTVYKTIHQSSPNPFQQMDKKDLEKYKEEVAQKQLKDQVQRKDDMHRELLDKSTTNTNQNTSTNDESLNNSAKKKSHTIPRSRSLLEKNRGSDGASTTSSSRDNSPTNTSPNKKQSQNQQQQQQDTHNTSGLTNATTTSTSNTAANKSATLSTSSMSTSKEDKPKKKSKLRSLSFLKTKKSKDQSKQQQAQ